MDLSYNYILNIINIIYDKNLSQTHRWFNC